MLNTEIFNFSLKLRNPKCIRTSMYRSPSLALGSGLVDRRNLAQFPVEVTHFSLLEKVQTRFCTLPASYAMSSRMAVNVGCGGISRLDLVQKLRMSGALLPLPRLPS